MSKSLYETNIEWLFKSLVENAKGLLQCDNSWSHQSDQFSDGEERCKIPVVVLAGSYMNSTPVIALVYLLQPFRFPIFKKERSYLELTRPDKVGKDEGYQHNHLDIAF